MRLLFEDFRSVDGSEVGTDGISTSLFHLLLDPAAVGLDAMLIVIGLIGAVVNALISVTCITIYKPAATAAPGA